MPELTKLLKPGRWSTAVKHAFRVVVVLVAFGAIVYASHEAGIPQKNGSAELPGAAFGWNLLFHVERAAALLGTIGLVTLIGWRALQGEFPVKFGQVEYEAKEAADAAAEVSEGQEERIKFLEILTGLRPESDLDAD